MNASEAMQNWDTCTEQDARDYLANAERVLAELDEPDGDGERDTPTRLWLRLCGLSSYERRL